MIKIIILILTVCAVSGEYQRDVYCKSIMENENSFCVISDGIDTVECKCGQFINKQCACELSFKSINTRCYITKIETGYDCGFHFLREYVQCENSACTLYYGSHVVGKFDIID